MSRPRRARKGNWDGALLIFLCFCSGVLGGFLSTVLANLLV